MFAVHSHSAPERAADWASNQGLFLPKAQGAEAAYRVGAVSAWFEAGDITHFSSLLLRTISSRKMEYLSLLLFLVVSTVCAQNDPRGQFCRRWYHEGNISFLPAIVGYGADGWQRGR